MTSSLRIHSWRSSGHGVW